MGRKGKLKSTVEDERQEPIQKEIKHMTEKVQLIG